MVPSVCLCAVILCDTTWCPCAEITGTSGGYFTFGVKGSAPTDRRIIFGVCVKVHVRTLVLNLRMSLLSYLHIDAQT